MSRIRAAFIRGGTSKGLYFHASDLPTDKQHRDKLLLKAMGSPDPAGTQLDGMGGAISSTSKVVITSKKIIDGLPFINYNFGQVSIHDPKIDWSGSCANLASGIAPFVLNEGGYADCIESIARNMREDSTKK